MSTQTGNPSASEKPTAAPRVVVAIPMPNDPDWALFDVIPDDVPIIVIDDSDGKLAPPPRANATYYDYAAQRAVMGKHWEAIPHRSAATRNFGHYLAYREGYDIIIALDYDCRARPGWLETHLDLLGPVSGHPALSGRWINTIEAPGFYSRGYPYELRNPVDAPVEETTATGEIRLNMGVWDNVLDLNGIDKLQSEPPAEPGLHADQNVVALGMIPLCGMNTAFRAELTPAYFFLPDVWVNGTWQLSRHDDIWGGYIVQALMGRRGDLVSFGRPVVEHTRQSKIERVVTIEQYMHLMSWPFYELVDQAMSEVAPSDYTAMFAAFTEAYRKHAARSALPSHYRAVFVELGEAMQRWADCFA